MKRPHATPSAPRWIGLLVYLVSAAIVVGVIWYLLSAFLGMGSYIPCGL